MSVLCQYHAFLITLALQYSLKSGHLMPPALLFLVTVALAIQGLLWSHTNFRVFSLCKNASGILIRFYFFIFLKKRVIIMEQRQIRIKFVVID